MSESLAIMLKLDGVPVLVVGQGAIGRRRAGLLVEAGAAVLAIDPAPGIVAGDGVDLLREPYNPAHLDGRRLVLASATAEVNRRVVDDCRARAVWVNSASDPDHSDFHLPAVWRDGPIILAVATGGSPTLARHLRDRAAGAVPPAAAALADLLNGLRPELRSRVPDPNLRAKLLRDWSDPAWLDYLQTHGPHATQTAMRRRLP